MAHSFYMVLNVATSNSHPNNSYYGLAIGFTLVAGAFALSVISGGAFDPALSLGPAVLDMFAWPTLWVFPVAQTLAGIVAGISFRAVNPDGRCVGHTGHPLADQSNSTNH